MRSLNLENWNWRTLFIRKFFSLGAVFSALILLTSFLLYELQHNLNIDTVKHSVEHKLSMQSKNIISELEKGAVLVRFLADQPSLLEALNGPRSEGGRQAAAMFSSLAKQVPNFDQVRLLDSGGVEVVRVNHQSGVPHVVSVNELQDKSSRYYFKRALQLDAGDVYISRFDLNMEHGKFEIPYKAVIRLASPVYDNKGVKRGVVIINFLTDKLIRRFLDAQDQVGVDYLLDMSGSYIYSHNEAERWGSILPDRSGKGLAYDMPQAWNVISGSSRGTLLNGKGLFVYRDLNLSSELQVDTDSGVGGGDWKMVTFVSKEELQFMTSVSGKAYISISIASLFITWLVAWNWAKALASKDISYKRMGVLISEKQELLKRQLKIQEHERKELAHSLHDEMGQMLIAIQSHAAYIEMECKEFSNPRLMRSAQVIRQTARDMLKGLRSKFHRLHPILLSKLGLVAAVEEMAMEWMEREEIACHFESSGEISSLPDETSIRLYRIIQEALSNVVKYAEASDVSIELVLDHEQLKLSVSDNGKGFSLSDRGIGLGLVGMREYAEAMDGEVDFITAPGKGFRVLVTIPVGAS